MKMLRPLSALPASLLLSLSVCLGSLLVCLPAQADGSFDNAFNTYQARQYDTAFKQFSELAAAGDNHAKSFLAMMTLRGQGTPRDINAGAELARQCAEGGEPTCYAIYAELNLPGQGLPVNLEQARRWTRKAIAGGDLRAGYLLWQAYALDPANQYIVDGKSNIEKYNQLRHRVVSQRSNQIEAIDALAAAASTGYAPARLMLSTLLIEQSGGGTSDELITLLNGNPELPEKFINYLRLAQQIQALGPTRAAPKLIVDALPSARASAAAALVQAGKTDATQCKDFRLMSISNVSELTDGVWLPLTNPLVADTYPIRGRWDEQWKVFYCGAERVLNVRFEADGMGGADYRFSG